MSTMLSIIGCALGGVLIAAACSDDDESFKETDDFAKRMAAARERKWHEREAKERRRSVKAIDARSKASLDDLVAVERDLDELLK